MKNRMGSFFYLGRKNSGDRWGAGEKAPTCPPLYPPLSRKGRRQSKVLKHKILKSRVSMSALGSELVSKSVSESVRERKTY